MIRVRMRSVRNALLLSSVLLPNLVLAQDTPQQPDAAAPDAAAPDAAAPDAAAPDAAAPDAKVPDTAPAEAKPEAQAEPKETTPPPKPAPEPGEGTVIDGWEIMGLPGGKRLPGGKETGERCGYLRDVIVQKADAVEKTVMTVPCQSGPAGLEPGKATLAIVEAPPEPVVKEAPEPIAEPVAQAPATPIEEAKEAEQPAVEEAEQPAVEEATPPTQEVAPISWSPADPATLTQTAGPLAPIAATQMKTGGKVMLSVEVRRSGEVRGVSVVSAPNPFLGKKAAALVKTAKWRPAQVGPTKVDSVVKYNLKFPLGTAASTGPQVADQSGPKAKTGKEGDNNTKPKEEAEEKKPEKKKREKPFLKGELTELGATEVMNKATSIGVGLGGTFIDKTFFAELRPTIALHFGDFHLGGSLPLRFEVADTSNLNVLNPSSYGAMFANAGRFRKEDYDNILKLPYSDLLRPISFLTYGKKEDHFFADITRMRSQTIGHGALLRRYTPNTDVDRSLLMAEVDAYADFGGFEFVTGPLPIPRMVGGLVFVKPLGLFLDDYFSKSLSFGLSYFGDLNAPTKLTQVANPLTPLNAKFPAIACTAPQAGTTEYDCGTDASLVFNNHDALVGDMVHAVGGTAEIKLVKWKFVDFKTYVDYSELFFPGVPEDNIAPFNAGGATLGGLLRLSFGSQLKNKDDDPLDPETPRTARHAFRFVLEGRGFQPQYLPSYFNATYEIDRFQFGQVNNLDRGSLPTKIGALARQADEGFRMGYYAEASYQWVNHLAASVVIEDALAVGGPSGGLSTVPSARNFALHLETSGEGRLQAFATYRYRNFSDISKLLQLRSDNELLFLGARFNLLFFSFNLGVRRSFKVGFTQSDSASPPYATVDTNNDGVVDDQFYRHSSVGYQNVWSAVFDVEVGWQF